jgi:hypothetical protein
MLAKKNVGALELQRYHALDMDCNTASIEGFFYSAEGGYVAIACENVGVRMLQIRGRWLKLAGNHNI